MTKSFARVVGNLKATLIVSAALLLTVGCASQPAELAPQATEALNSIRSQLFTAKAQIQEASNAAQDLADQPRTDLKAQIDRLNSAVAALNATRARARSTVEAQMQTTDQYFAKWDESLKTMSEDTAERAEKRVEKAKEAAAKLRKDLADIREQLIPMMDELNEATKYLATDTTKSGLDVVRPKLVSATKRAPKVIKEIDDTISDIDAIRAGK